MMRKRRKYGNTKVEIDGHLFDSKKEAGHYLYLRTLQESGEISGLEMQVPFEIIPSVYRDEIIHLKTKDKVVKRCVQKATHYIADFVYNDSSGTRKVVDVKSDITRRNAEYRLKKKMMLAFLGIEIMEV